MRFIAALVIVAVAAFGVWRWWGASVAAQEIGAIRAAGEPATLAELQTWRGDMPIDGANAADVYRDAVARAVPYASVEDPVVTRGLPLFVDVLYAPKQTLNADALEAIRRYVELNADAAAKLHEAAGLTYCRYPFDLTKGPLERGDEAVTKVAATAVEVLGWRIVYFVARGEMEPAIGAFEDFAAVARSLENETSERALEARLSVQHTIGMIGSQIAGYAELNEEQLRRLGGCFDDAGNDRMMRRAIIAERAIVVAMFADPKWALGSEPSVFSAYRLLRVSGVMARDEAHYLATMRRYLAVLDLSEPRRMAEVKRVNAEVERERDGSLRVVSDLMMTPVLHAIRSDMRARMDLRLAQAAVAVKRYHLARGDWPATLAAVSPDFAVAPLMDPWTGETMRYRSDAEGVVVYSVSENGVDDGGVYTRRVGGEVPPAFDEVIPLTPMTPHEDEHKDEHER
ncbi:MAG: hypothetical protein GC159_03740 [Phycisphaera sp.]|nr:hypothetical protein [Phycisphaera sp.]